MDQRKEFGKKGEERACRFLKEHGVRILEKNFRCRMGEIDLIGSDGDYLIVFEVKSRKHIGSGLPAEAVDGVKRRKICRTFNYYRMKKHIDDFTPVRFDVVEVYGDGDCHWIRNAFEFVE